MRVECRQDVTIAYDDPIEFGTANFEKIKRIEEDLNRRIRENNERFTIEDVYHFMEMDLPKLPPYADQDYYRTYGWDRKGFRQLYRKVVTYVPIE